MTVAERSEVVTISRGEWRVVFLGALLAPSFHCRGAAAAYLDAIQRGTRRPEYPIPASRGKRRGTP